MKIEIKSAHPQKPNYNPTPPPLEIRLRLFDFRFCVFLYNPQKNEL
jgi:hypothetical protein